MQTSFELPEVIDRDVHPGRPFKRRSFYRRSPGRTFTWDIDNRVSSVTAQGGTVDMVYDYTGSRIKKDTAGPGGATYFPFSGYEVDPSGVITKYIRAGIETLASNIGGEKRFYHNDHLGGVNVITDIFGARVQLTEYDPWGKVTRSEGSADPTKRFTGKELDPESGLYYYGGRYYDPDLARFVSPDPFVGDPDDPQNLNRYSYVLNNPVNYIDPSGYFHRHKTGGFWNSVFGKFFRIFIDVALIYWGLPPVGEGLLGFSTLVGASNLGPDLANLLGNNSYDGISGADVPGSLAPVVFTAGGGGYLSPSLLLAARAECDTCSDANWTWLALLRGLLQPNEAQAGHDEGGGRRFHPRYQVPKSYKAFTEGNFRDNLAVRTGKMPDSNVHAHHVFTKTHKKEFFERFRIDVNDPKYGAWWERGQHLTRTAAYERETQLFLRVPNITREDVLRFGRQMGQKYGFEVGF